MKIIQSRLEGVLGGIVESDAVQFASRKVAAVSGDARRALDICRRAVELAETESQSIETLPSTPSKKPKDTAMTSLGSSKSGKVTIATVKRAISEATTSPMQQYLRSLPLSSKLLLAALLAKTRRSGLAESVLGEIIEEAKRIAKMASCSEMVEFLLTDVTPAPKDQFPQSPAKQVLKAPRVLSIGMAAIDLMEAGIIGLEARKGDRTGKIRLNIGDEDLKLAFKDDPDLRDLGFSA